MLVDQESLDKGGQVDLGVVSCTPPLQKAAEMGETVFKPGWSEELSLF